jgi:hypothetical protein
MNNLSRNGSEYGAGQAFPLCERIPAVITYTSQPGII